MGAKLFIGTPECEMKVSSSKEIWYGLCEITSFLWQPIANLRRGSAYKIIHISAVTYPRLLNLIPNKSLDMAYFSLVAYANYLICIFINTYENIKNVVSNGGIRTRSILSQLL